MLTGLSMAQAQNPECMTNLSIYAEHAKVKNYDAAYEPWKMVYETCPDINRANFTYGENILEVTLDLATIHRPSRWHWGRGRGRGWRLGCGGM